MKRRSKEPNNLQILFEQKGRSKEPANCIWKKMLQPSNLSSKKQLEQYGRDHVQQKQSKAKTLWLSLFSLIAKTHLSEKQSSTYVHCIAILKTVLPSYLIFIEWTPQPFFSLRHNDDVFLTNMPPSHLLVFNLCIIGMWYQGPLPFSFSQGNND